MITIMDKTAEAAGDDDHDDFFAGNVHSLREAVPEEHRANIGSAKRLINAVKVRSVPVQKTLVYF